MTSTQTSSLQAIGQIFCSASVVLGMTVLANHGLGAEIRQMPRFEDKNPVLYVLASDDASIAAHSKMNLSTAIDERKALLKRSLSVKFVSADGKQIGQWGVRLRDKPEWVVYEVRFGSAHAAVSAEQVATHLTKLPLSFIPAPVQCTLTSSVVDKYGVERGTTDCLAKGGYSYDPLQVADRIKQSFENKESLTTFVLTTVDPTIVDARNGANTTLKLLARGVSDFKGSGAGRKANVRRAIGEKVNTSIVPTGTEFSFNKMLGGPVTVGNGWSMALVIFDGWDLQQAPGGGICQASTTAYRAALAAGFPIVKQKNHSLYVHYYEAHGVGQDATVFPGKQDLVFINDTAHPVYLQAHYEGETAYVEVFGVPDGRQVAMEGPYFGRTAPSDLLYKGRAIRNNEIAWRRTTTLADGTKKAEIFVSTYTAIPKSLSKTVVATVTTTPTLHAAAQPELVADH